MKIVLALLLIAVSVGTSFGQSDEQPKPGPFKLAGANQAVADRDKAIARAAAVYKQSVLLAERQCNARLTQISASPMVQQDATEKAKLQQEIEAIGKMITECLDKTFTVAIVSSETVGSVSQGLHKGMSKAELFQVFPDKPAMDSTDADGTEEIQWVKRAFVSNGGGGFDAGGGGFIGGGTSSKAVEITDVTLKNGVVTDFRVQKN